MSVQDRAKDLSYHLASHLVLVEIASEFEDRPVWEWTEEEVYQHINRTFQNACRVHPELMEKYQILLPGIDFLDERTALMRTALQETFSQRYPPRVYGKDRPVD
jgi:hypothetical protein